MAQRAGGLSGMALDISDPDHGSAAPRSIGLVVIGLLFLALAGFLFYTTIYQQPDGNAVTRPVYDYEIKQGVSASVNYRDTSFFADGSGQGNSAYIAKLTDTIDLNYDYNFSGSAPVELLSYRYDITADVMALYKIKLQDDKEEAQPTVWRRAYTLDQQRVDSVDDGTISIQPRAVVPYGEYKKLIDQLNTGLALSMSGDAVVTMRIVVDGRVSGRNFQDSKTITTTIPLTEQLYRIESNFEKESRGQVGAPEPTSRWDIRQYLGEIIVGFTALLGLAAIAYGLRMHIFRSPYQRELDQIYRLHDGIIIRASKPADFEGKTIVPVQTFEDMLNLEEELKIPIVAAPAGPEATQFITVHGDVTYVYTLGTPLLGDSTASSIEKYFEFDQQEAAGQAHKTTHRRSTHKEAHKK